MKTFTCSKGYWLNIKQILLNSLDRSDDFFGEYGENKLNQNVSDNKSGKYETQFK